MDLKNIRQNVFRYLAQKNSKALLDDCIALLIAEILGYINKRNAGDYKPWENICLEIKNFNALNKNVLLEKIKKETLENVPLEKKREWLEAKAIYSFDMECIVFTDSFINIAKSQIYSLRTNYGEKDYSITTIKNQRALSKINTTIEITKKKDSTSNDETELNTFWKILETEARKSLFPFWKWKISTNEFESLEEKLIALINSKGQRFVIKDHSFKLAVYYSEWYKRKYKGNDTDIDPVFIPISPQKIWRNLSTDIRNKYLITINESNNKKSVRWDDSLRLLGGLPLNYLTRGENNPSRVFAKVFNDLRNNEEPDLNELNINNQALRQSTMPGGSIFEYINELNNENYYFDEKDRKESPFKEFIDFVESGLKEYKENISKKFSILWQIKQHPDLIYIYPTISVKLKPEESGEDHLFIYDKRLNGWGIQDTLSCFEILVRLKYSETDQFEEISGFYFNRCTNGKVICRSEVKWQISDNPKNLEKVEFVLKSGAFEKTIQTEKVPNYIQLWNYGYGQWSNRQRNGSRSAVLFLNNNASTKNAEQQISLKSIKQEYYWANIKNELLILNNGKEKKLYQKNGDIDVRPKERELFRNIVIYNEDGMLSYINEEATHFVYLVKEPIPFEVYFYEKSGSNKIEINKQEYSVQYMQLGMDGFMPYLDDQTLNQGFVKFKIMYGDIYEAILDCYVLKKDANINRVVETKRVVFENINDVFIDSSEFGNLNDNIFVDDEEKIELDSVNISVGSHDNYLQIPVIRPLDRSNDIFQGENHITTAPLIPIKFAENFVVRTINRDGIVRKVLADEITKFQKLRVIYYNSKGIGEETGIKEMPNLVRLTTYTKEISRNNDFLFLKRGKDAYLEDFKHYKFCFLSLKDSKVEEIILEKNEKINPIRIGFYVNTRDNGIIFQSFKDENLIYQETYHPIFVAANQSKINSKTKQENRESRIKNYKKEFDYNLALYHFEIAIEHNLYFGMFDILLAMEDQPQILAQFYLSYYKNCEDKKRPIDFKALYRFADEMLFDWMLIPRIIWTEVVKEKYDKNWITELFKHKKNLSGLEQHALVQCCEKYWVSSLNAPDQNNKIYTNIKRKKNLHTFFIQKPEDKIEVLKELDKPGSLYARLLEILQK